MSKFSQDKINSIFLRFPVLKYLISSSFRKVTGICPFEIVRGTINSTEAGYQPQGAQPRDYTDFEQLIIGFDPVIPDWEDSVSFPFDGTLDQRYKEKAEIKITNELGISSFEREGISALGLVFEYEDGREFKLPKLEDETETAYQARFKKELEKELDRLVLPKNKKKDKWGREYYEQLHTKYFVKKHGTGRYYAAYFISDEVSPIIKAWLGNEHFMKQGVQKQVTMLILNTDTKEIFKGVRADGFKGNRGFFDRIDKYRLCMWRIPEFDLTYDFDNSTENEDKKRRGFRGSYLSVDRTWFRIEKTSYIRNPGNKEIIGALVTFGSVNDLLSRSGVSINTKIQIGGKENQQQSPHYLRFIVETRMEQFILIQKEKK